MPVDRATLRAQLFLRAVLPLLATIAKARPGLLPPWNASVLFGIAHSEEWALLHLSGTQAQLTHLSSPPERDTVDIAIIFNDASQLNRFFSGKACWPTIRGALKHPRLMWCVIRLLMTLKVLQPQQELPTKAEDKALHVRLVLTLISRALAHLARHEQGELTRWIANSPERVFQWSIGKNTLDAGSIAVYLRMAQGKFQVGQGFYPHRRPFVHFAFRDLDAALAMLTTQDSQMTGVRDGLLETIGCPEYTRKLVIQMQRIDQLLLEG